MSLVALIGLGRDIGSRFALVGLLPTGVLALFVLALVWSGAPADAPDLDRVLDHARDLDAWTGGLLFLSLVVLTLVLQPLQLALVRWLEGYWPPALNRLAAAGRGQFAAQYEQLAAASAPRTAPPTAADLAAMAQAAVDLRLLPPRGALMPTRLGNALRAAEVRAGEPYGLDAVVAWPRLYPLLSEPVRAQVDELRDSLDLAARFCAMFAVAAVVALALLAAHGWWLLVPVGLAVLSWVSYHGAVAAAIAYGEGIRTGIDLHRLDLLTALRLPLPATLEEERELNRRLSGFLRQGWPDDFVYEHS